LETADIDPANRLSYARALQICGTARSRRTLCHWTQDRAVPVRIAALQALGHVGLDAQAAPVAIEALEDADVTVRAVAAAALRNWNGAGDVAGQLARHLDDLWPVAVQAAQSLRTMRESGRAALRTAAARPDLAGQLARQTLWDITTPC
jgi:HEAT repeat protein